MASGEHPQRKAPELVQEWQRHILNRVSAAIFFLTSFALVVTARSELARHKWTATFPLVLTVIGTACFAFMRRLPLHVRSYSLIAVLIAAETYLLIIEGYQVPNPFTAAIMTTAVAALLLSTSQAYLVLGVLLVGFGAMGYRFVSGKSHVLGAMSDTTVASNWIRILIVFGMVGGATIWSIAFLMQHLRDALTKREELFDALRAESAERINHLERERQLELQLRQSQKMEALGELAGGVAHDFNNLLLVIIAGAEQTQLATSEEERAAAVDEVIGAADRAASLTQRLLAFSRKQVTERTLVDINRAVTDSLSLIKRLIPSNITLTFEGEEGLGVFRGSTTELDQVLMNLCLNARDALPTGGHVWVRTRLEPGPVRSADRLLLSVTDDGLGISSEDSARLFEPFFTSKAPGKGTGLGLAVVRNIVDQYGGDVYVKSTLGQGSEFVVSFPRGESVDMAPANSLLPLRRGANQQILVVDDDERVRSSLARILSAAGYCPTVASSGEQAIEILKQSSASLDLVVTDIVMPGFSGRDVHDIALAVAPKLPLLVCSGYVAGTLDSDFFEQPLRAFLAKPFHTNQLLEKVDRLLAEARSF